MSDPDEPFREVGEDGCGRTSRKLVIRERGNSVQLLHQYYSPSQGPYQKTIGSYKLDRALETGLDTALSEAQRSRKRVRPGYPGRQHGRKEMMNGNLLDYLSQGGLAEVGKHYGLAKSRARGVEQHRTIAEAPGRVSAVLHDLRLHNDNLEKYAWSASKMLRDDTLEACRAPEFRRDLEALLHELDRAGVETSPEPDPGEDEEALTK